MDVLEFQRVGKFNFFFYIEVWRRVREVENLIRKLEKYREIWLRGENFMLYKIIKYLVVVISVWDG